MKLPIILTADPNGSKNDIFNPIILRTENINKTKVEVTQTLNKFKILVNILFIFKTLIKAS